MKTTYSAGLIRRLNTKVGLLNVIASQTFKLSSAGFFWMLSRRSLESD